MMMTKKILLLATMCSLTLATSCGSGNDAPRIKPDTETPQQPNEPQQPNQPGKATNPKQPDTPSQPADPKKPSDYHMAKRMFVTPIEAKTAQLLSTLKIEEFAWGGDQGAIKLADLLPFVIFYSSEPNSPIYTLKAEDLKHLELVGLKYQEDDYGDDALTFKVSYNGVSGSELLSIPISRRDYFLQKFQVDEAFASKYYLGGMVRQFGVYSGEFLKSYDRTKYAVVLSEPRADHYNNTLTFRGTVNLPRYKKEDLLTLDFEVKGFKPLSTLKKDLTFSTTIDLNEWMRERLKKLKSKDDAAILRSLQLNPIQWLKLASANIQYAGELSWKNHDEDLVGRLSGGLDARDVYLQNVRFEPKSAHYDKDAATVTIEVQLTSANDVVIDGVTTKLVVRSVHL